MIFPLTRSFVETLVDSLVHLHDILKTATYSGAGIYNHSPARASDHDSIRRNSARRLAIARRRGPKTFRGAGGALGFELAGVPFRARTDNRNR
jgi:hypothetical protein